MPALGAIANRVPRYVAVGRKRSKRTNTPESSSVLRHRDGVNANALTNSTWREGGHYVPVMIKHLGDGGANGMRDLVVGWLPG